MYLMITEIYKYIFKTYFLCGFITLNSEPGLSKLSVKRGAPQLVINNEGLQYSYHLKPATILSHCCTGSLITTWDNFHHYF